MLAVKHLNPETPVRSESHMMHSAYSRGVRRTRELEAIFWDPDLCISSEVLESANLKCDLRAGWCVQRQNIPYLSNVPFFERPQNGSPSEKTVSSAQEQAVLQDPLFQRTDLAAVLTTKHFYFGQDILHFLYITVYSTFYIVLPLSAPVDSKKSKPGFPTEV